MGRDPPECDFGGSLRNGGSTIGVDWDKMEIPAESGFAKIVLLPARALVGAALFIYFGITRLFERRSDSKLRPTRRARHEVNRIARQDCPNAKVFRFDAVDANPERLWFIAIKTKTDAERERLRFDSGLHGRLRDILLQVGYPVSAVKLVFFIFESQETVDRDCGGSWHDAMQ